MYFLWILLYLPDFISSDFDDAISVKKKFDYYKEKFERTYETDAKEEIALQNFVNNLKKVTELNDNSKSSDIVYTLNKYADQNIEELSEIYALDITPYDNLSNIDPLHRIESIKLDKDIEATKLYDLRKVDDLFESFKKRYNKNYTRNLDKTVHYYRFLKTLIDLNRNNFNQAENKRLDANADIVKEPNEFFF